MSEMKRSEESRAIPEIPHFAYATTFGMRNYMCLSQLNFFCKVIVKKSNNKEK
jgi:hypothetical protein